MNKLVAYMQEDTDKIRKALEAVRGELSELRLAVKWYCIQTIASPTYIKKTDTLQDTEYSLQRFYELMEDGCGTLSLSLDAYRDYKRQIALIDKQIKEEGEAQCQKD